MLWVDVSSFLLPISFNGDGIKSLPPPPPPVRFNGDDDDDGERDVDAIFGDETSNARLTLDNSCE